jgi:nucleotide-binding universal stress UspA family protein
MEGKTVRVQLKSIICTTDFSDTSNYAVSYGIALAKEFSAKLYLCHVIDLPSTGMYGDIVSYPVGQQDRIINYAHGYLSRLVGDVPIDWEPLVTMGHAATEVARLAKEKCVDLAVSATHGRSGLKRIVLGSVTGRLLRTLPCPLLVVRNQGHSFVATPTQEIKLQRILVGCDFSHDSNLAFQFGLSLAQEFQSELHLVHVIPPYLYEDLVKRAGEPEEAFQHDLRDRLIENLNNMVPEEARHWCSPQTVLAAGQPHEELIKYSVVHDVNLIVLGVRGHGMVESILVGSTAVRVARGAPCPVLVVRPMADVT